VDPSWRSKKIIVFDNASIHSTKEVKTFMQEMQILYMFTVVASFLAVPIEIVFGIIKRKFQKK
jgi:hypothetical protein